MARPCKGNPKGEQIKHKFTEENLKKLKEAYAFYATQEEACFYAGITVQTYHNWRNDNAKLFEEIEAFRNHPRMKAKNSLVKSFEQRPDMALKFLEKVDPEFTTKEKKEIEIKGKLNIDPFLGFLSEGIEE